MSHNSEIKQLFENQEFVPIAELRVKYNYRSRIDELRKQGLDIQSFKIRNQFGKLVYGYKLIKADPAT